MGWPASEQQQKLQAVATAAAELLAKEDYQSAAARYLEVLNVAQDPSMRKPALAGLKVCQRELAREVAPQWVEAVMTDATGGDATSIFQELASKHPTNASLRLHAR